MAKHPQPDEDCTPECLDAQPAGADGKPRCICEYVNAEIEAYYTEPADMFQRESGCY
ncbi:hypothetical protein [Streptomyces sp. NPDC006307]|uniref:hypothetical protein n=1 Tax=Streptomyces sp. NPDC006307 TaxID=3156748 RepID=UPI0033B133C3